LSKARRAGVALDARPGTRDAAEAAEHGRKPSAKRSRASSKALKKEPSSRKPAAAKAAATRKHAP